MNEDGGLPPWLNQEYKTFRKVVLDPEFPCYFGTSGEKTGELRYAYAEEGVWTHVPDALRTFLALSREHPRIRHALALFVEPSPRERTLAEYRDQFWSILNFLHEVDSSPWPLNRPEDPEDPLWEFCFDGEPMFVFASCPAYKKRISRELGRSLVLLFQPRRVFDDIKGGTKAGTRAREVIRRKMEKMEGMPAHPDMGNYGDPSVHEWKQYFLPDDNTPVAGRCPFHRKPQYSKSS
ncbi:YqcI/YcgG family protein [Archangium sp.]|uniref:YqcI/YcgG family protein n=1 Tax=Archangium sp. TaxID=1872627 RepID=UPI002D7416B6|nr:YqcI/YcgG family protein [Archangium sp.]HYO54046.1 YqcI/YcgG family protein [Archangium sp.]